MSLTKNRVFSGIQSTGRLHLGNYLGALQRFAQLQDDYDCLYCVVDLHSITVWIEPSELVNNTREVASAIIACGVDPERHVVFNQSQVSEHSELAWIFNCVTRMGWLSRMTQFKDKAGQNREKVSSGLFVYPNLMAADVLLYKATHVPVGDDQKQHMELMRDVAQKFNNDFAASIKGNGFGRNFFPLPEPLIIGEATRVMSLRDGTKKMAKSDPSDYSRINLTDDADLIAGKIRKARTDSMPLPDNLDDLKLRPEANNLMTIFAAIADQSKQQTLDQFAGKMFGQFKPILADLIIARLGPITVKIRELLACPEHIDQILRKGSSKARPIAAKTLTEVKNIVGFVH